MPAQAPQVLLAVDLVESVRLMRGAEWLAVRRWREWLAAAREQVLQPWGITELQSLGDGLLLLLDELKTALPVAQGLHALAAQLSLGLPAEEQLWLRVGVHEGRLPQGSGRWHGLDVLRVQQLAAQAAPGSSLFSAEALSSMGELACAMVRPLQPMRLGAWEAPMRAAELQVEQPRTETLPGDDIRPRLAAVLDTLPAEADPRQAAALLDDLVRVLSRCELWRVCSGQSGLALAGLQRQHAAIGQALQVDWLAQLQLRWQGGRRQMRLRLLRASDGELIVEDDWGDIPGLLPEQSERQASLFARQVLEQLCRERRGFDTPVALRRLDAYSVLMQAIGSTHRGTPQALRLGYEQLRHLAQRHPRASEVAAWLALWHVFDQSSMRAPLGGRDEVERSLELAQRLDEGHPLVLTAMAHQQLKLGMQLESAEQALTRALQANPNEALAWLFMAHLHLRDNRPQQAVRAIESALCLSPLEPARYFFDNYAAGVYTDAGEVERGLQYARRAHSLNPWHLNSLAQLIISEVRAGQLDEARAHARLYLQQRPQARATRLLEGLPERLQPYVKRQIEAYLVAGIPA